MKNNHLVLIADDDTDDQTFIIDAFIELQSDITIETTLNGLELMERLHIHAANGRLPSVIVMDLNMPLLDGYGALSKIKNNSQLADIPVYILSTSRFEYDNYKSKELGAKQFYTKPFKLSDYKKIISEIYAALTHT